MYGPVVLRHNSSTDFISAPRTVTVTVYVPYFPNLNTALPTRYPCPNLDPRQLNQMKIRVANVFPTITAYLSSRSTSPGVPKTTITTKDRYDGSPPSGVPSLRPEFVNMPAHLVTMREKLADMMQSSSSGIY